MYQGTNPKALQSMKRIEDALVKLMQETPYENVSVTAICKEAGISRPTFYKNFNDKDEVISSIFKRRSSGRRKSSMAKGRWRFPMP
ncbi:MAG: TetR/AcrR family transcriptional regulator [Eggerthellaceae bacterium]|jgi:AcrR family transcriptional regulator